MEQLLLNGAIVAIGLIVLLLAWASFRRPAGDPWLAKFFAYVAFPLLFQAGFALLLVGTGYRHIDAMHDWGWESWFGFGSAALLAMLFAVTRFQGASRVVLTLLATGWLLFPAWAHFWS